MRSSHSGTPATLTTLPGRSEFEHLLVKALELVLAWHQRMVERRQLARLNEVELRDIGLSRADIAGEISKPFWRP